MIARTRGGRAGLDTTRVVLRPGSVEPASSEALATAIALAVTAAPGETLASPATARQLAARFDVIPAGAAAPAGALRVVPTRSRPSIEVRSYRGRELTRLVDVAERCFAERRPRFVEVRAPAGHGKTRLREALVARVGARREVDWLVASAGPLGEAAPLALLRSADPDWFHAAARGGLADRAAALAAARRWLEARAARRPVGVILEDIQRADEMSRDLIAHLRESLEDLPVLVVTLARTPEPGDDRATVGDDRAPLGVEVVTLGPLDPRTATDLVRGLAPSASDDAVADVVARAAGHPFFLEELARELCERGPSPSGAPLPLPATVEAVVQQRLDRLPGAVREVAEAAAVVGRWFWREAVQRALPEPLADADLDAALADLERRGLVAPTTPALVDDDRYQFVQALVRDVAYGRPGARERRLAHRRVAEWLASRAPAAGGGSGGPGIDDAEVLLAIAQHRELAGDRDDAAACYRAAGRRCLALFAYREATAALRRAVALAPEVDAELAELSADALAQGESLAEAETMLHRALVGRGVEVEGAGDGGDRAGVDDAEPASDAATAARLWQKVGHVRSRRGDPAGAIAAFRRGLARVYGADDTQQARPASWAHADARVPSLLHGGLGWVLGYQLEHHDQGLPHCERAVALLEGTPHLRDLAHALSRLGGTYMRAGRFRDQLACNQRNLAIASELGDLQMQLVAHVNLGVVHGVLGDIDDAIAHTEAARALCVRTGARTTAGLVASNLGGYHLDRGDLATAERLLDEGVRTAERVGSRHVLPESYGFVARLRAARGDLAGAAQAASQALGIAREQALSLDAGIALRLAAQIHARAGHLAEALTGLDEAAASIGAGDRLEAARTAAARARILARAGDPGAAAYRAEAAEAFARLGARHDLAVLDDADEIR